MAGHSLVIKDIMYRENELCERYWIKKKKKTCKELNINIIMK